MYTMERHNKIGGVLLLLLLATVSAEQPKDGFQQHLETLDKRFKQEIASLRSEYDTKIAELGQRIVGLEETNEKLVKENAEIKAKVGFLEKTVEECEHGHDDEKEEIVDAERLNARKIAQNTADFKPDGRDVSHDEASQRCSDNQTRHKRALGDGLNIAFTAYLDHDLDNQGHNQVLVFNKVLLNHGAGYNNNTGAFTAPVAGVYSFTFFIGQGNIHQFYVHLVVNNNPVVDAFVDSIHNGQDIQGGNAANLMLSKGDSVMVRHHESSVGGHLEGSNALRITSFSGFLVYPVESDIATIVGK